MKILTFTLTLLFSMSSYSLTYVKFGEVITGDNAIKGGNKPKIGEKSLFGGAKVGDPLFTSSKDFKLGDKVLILGSSIDFMITAIYESSLIRVTSQLPLGFVEEEIVEKEKLIALVPAQYTLDFSSRKIKKGDSLYESTLGEVTVTEVFEGYVKVLKSYGAGSGVEEIIKSTYLTKLVKSH